MISKSIIAISRLATSRIIFRLKSIKANLNYGTLNLKMLDTINHTSFGQSEVTLNSKVLSLAFLIQTRCPCNSHVIEINHQSFVLPPFPRPHSTVRNPSLDHQSQFLHRFRTRGVKSRCDPELHHQLK